jgi:hypothetical protein
MILITLLDFIPKVLTVPCKVVKSRVEKRQAANGKRKEQQKTNSYLRNEKYMKNKPYCVL